MNMNVLSTSILSAQGGNQRLTNSARVPPNNGFQDDAPRAARA